MALSGVPQAASLSYFTRTREYGTLGLAQTLKQLRDAGHTFPLYADGQLAKGSVKDLGVLKYHHNLDIPPNKT